MKTIIERLKSPVVIIQIISIVVGLIIFFKPDITDSLKAISTTIVSIISILAGLNNPADKKHF